MTQSNCKIAITGGIGSGKSEVCSMIERAGLPVYSCDKIYTGLLNSGAFNKPLEECFGKEIFNDGKLNKSALSNIVFNDKIALNKLNEITHQKILEVAFNTMEEHKLSFLEVPLLFENGFEKLFDGVIVVLRNLDDRIGSIIKRSGISTNEAILRIKSQFNYDNCDFAEYYVIHNNTNLNGLRAQVDSILNCICEKQK